jgi:hypothetical protein
MAAVKLQMEVPVILLGHHGACFEITLLGRQDPDGTGEWDRDALRAHVAIEAAEFHGSFEIQTFSHELTYLRRLLEELERRAGEATTLEFRFLEEDTTLSFDQAASGHITLTATSRRGIAPYQCELRVAIRVDRGYLPRWIQALDAALERYPLQVSWEPTLPPADR